MLLIGPECQVMTTGNQVEWLLSLDSGKRNKQDTQNPMGEEPGLKEAAWILGGEQRTDTMGCLYSNGRQRRPGEGVVTLGT